MNRSLEFKRNFFKALLFSKRFSIPELTFYRSLIYVYNDVTNCSCFSFFRDSIRKHVLEENFYKLSYLPILHNYRTLEHLLVSTCTHSLTILLYIYYKYLITFLYHLILYQDFFSCQAYVSRLIMV